MSRATPGDTPYRNAELFTNYYLDNRVQELDEWRVDEESKATFSRLQSVWDRERELVDDYTEGELLDAWIEPVLSALGYSWLSETTLPEGGGQTDLLLFDSVDERAAATRRRQTGEPRATFGAATAVLEAKRWGVSFDRRLSERRSYRDASHQINYYLEHTPETTAWGVLTNGRRWRLYGTKEYATETFYEVDLPALLTDGDLEAFNYFYAFFRPTAFGDTRGFLETVWNESETAAQELGADVRDSVFTALRVLAAGFVETNDLTIEPGDEAALAELKHQSLVLLYRLMFVLYAESRRLLQPSAPDASAEYRETFGLNELRRAVYETVAGGGSFDDYSELSTQRWQRLQDLFGLIDGGNERLGVPAYNGGLFDPEDNQFLRDNAVSDRHLAEVLYLIGTTTDADGRDVLADYADLDTRHLGSIYEGLLEHGFRIADEPRAAVPTEGGQVWRPASAVDTSRAAATVDAGELYVVADDDERKTTGAYYTPDHVVRSVIEETVGPKVDEIDTRLRERGLTPSDRAYFRDFWQAIQELTILDPAMGSGHFLTATAQYLTERVMRVVREQEIQGYGEQDLKRRIATECLYGVDVNEMAVELAKLSMWLETLAADKPLAFLDHHLRCGDSLVGSTVDSVLSGDDGGRQTTLADGFQTTRRETLTHVERLLEELTSIDNDDLDSVKRIEETFAEIQDDPLYRRLFEFVNVHTAERFGVDVPPTAYETMAGAIESESDWNDHVTGTEWFADRTGDGRPREVLPLGTGVSGGVPGRGGRVRLCGREPAVRVHRLDSRRPAGVPRRRLGDVALPVRPVRPVRRVGPRPVDGRRSVRLRRSTRVVGQRLLPTAADVPLGAVWYDRRLRLHRARVRGRRQRADVTVHHRRRRRADAAWHARRPRDAAGRSRLADGVLDGGGRGTPGEPVRRPGW
ncbi:MAG: type I restriction-modification system methyltransferase subunit [halophilic archaeon J07HB67]|nr:MAG: type I restriction-modification system methyltransferase subunit [halophilic archaeon J07HB67]